jgi:glycosyltransferase involved in cell wall biosynthesis
MRPWRVLNILSTARAEGGSIARIVAALGNGLDCARYELHAWFLTDDGPLVSRVAAAGIQAKTFNSSRALREPAVAFRLWRDLRAGSFDLIHQHLDDRRLRWLVRSASRARVIVHLHDRPLKSDGIALGSVRIDCADAVIANSRATGASIGAPRPYVIYPGVEIADYSVAQSRPLGTYGLTFGTAGRLVSIKGIDHLIHALALLRWEFPELRLQIAGDGPERGALERQATVDGIRDQINFLGWRDDVSELLGSWDVVVQPSLKEGFSVAALEASASGLPVIASAVGGLAELIENAQTGWLVPTGDVNALAEKMRWMIVNPAARLAMGSAARRRAANFSTERMVGEVSNFYDELLGQSS